MHTENFEKLAIFRSSIVQQSGASTWEAERRAPSCPHTLGNDPPSALPRLWSLAHTPGGQSLKYCQTQNGFNDF